MLGGWLLIVAVVLLLTAVLLFHWHMEAHPAHKLPGPTALPFIGNLLPMLGGIEQSFKYVNGLTWKYFPMFRIWQGHVPNVFIVDPGYVETLASSQQHITKSFDYKFLEEWLGTGLLLSTGSKWHGRRKLLTPAFHFSILEQFVPVFSDKTAILVNKLRGHVNQTVNMVPLVTRCALDIICETAMGTNIHAQDKDDSPYVSAVYEINECVIHRILRPWLWPNLIYRFTNEGKKFYRCIEILHGFTLKVIRERRQERKKMQKSPKDEKKEDEMGGRRKKIAFLDLLLAASEENKRLSDEDIREEVDTFMFEGHDTTAMAMSWALLYIGAHADVQTKCVAELTEIFSGSDRTPTLADLGSMKYLERVIKETLRLRPSVPMIGRDIQQNGIKLGDHVLPAGTKFGIQIYNIHKIPSIYPEPEKFDPDRFLPENTQGRHPYAYIPFSAGPRNCIGQKFAMLEMKNLLSTLLRNFRFESVDFERDVQCVPDVILRPKHGVNIKIHPRIIP